MQINFMEKLISFGTHLALSTMAGVRQSLMEIDLYNFLSITIFLGLYWITVLEFIMRWLTPTNIFT